VLVFTSEEVWGTRYPDAGSVHLLEWPVVPQVDESELAGNALADRWQKIRTVRTHVFEEIEPRRRAKEIGSSLEAHVELILEPPLHSLNDVNWSEVLISGPVSLSLIEVTSHSTIWADGGKHYKVREGARVSVSRTNKHKCGRCWRYLPEVRDDGELCGRCDKVVNG
jgi:isoleucyl-tRNA synthetase